MQTLICLVHETGAKDWPKLLPCVNLVMNSQISSSTGMSPSEHLIGRSRWKFGAAQAGWTPRRPRPRRERGWCTQCWGCHLKRGCGACHGAKVSFVTVAESRHAQPASTGVANTCRPNIGSKIAPVWTAPPLSRAGVERLKRHFRRSHKLKKKMKQK